MIIKPKIELRGNSPTIEGTRTTVYQVMLAAKMDSVPAPQILQFKWWNRDRLGL